MNNIDVIEKLLKQFPELINEYEENKDYLEGLAYLVFEDIFVVYIINNIKNKDMNRISKIAYFIEEMLAYKDEEIETLIVVAVLEPLVFEREDIGSINQWFGKITRREIKKLEQYYFKE